MAYKKELEFLKLFFKKCNVQLLVLDSAHPLDRNVDFGFRQFMGRDNEYAYAFKSVFMDSPHQVVFRIKDQYLCNYMFLRYEDGPPRKAICIGPYLSRPITNDDISSLSQALNRPYHQLVNCYRGLPVLNDDHPLFSALYAFCELLWGKDTVPRFFDVNLALGAAKEPSKDPSTPSAASLAVYSKMLEMRYASENAMMRDVALGNTLKAELWRPSSHLSVMDARCQDPLRNLKNYCVITNTLLRKAAEQGNVHPVYLDELSRDYAFQIEACGDMDTCKKLLDGMVMGYTKLVSERATKTYSAPIQQVITYIDSNLENDLRLNVLEEKLCFNRNYLSKLFKKEVGYSITDYISSKRITLSMKLLGTTDLQIQEIAQKCGILDVNYFTKKFKKIVGQTPMEYRQALRSMLTKR